MKHLFTLVSIVLFTGSFLFGQQVDREKVILEIGTGTWCPYCPGAAMGADDLIANGHDVAVIEYHNGDDYANVYSNSRNSYYSVPGYPTAYFDGGNPYVGGSATQSMYSNYLPRVNQRLAIPSSFTIDVTGTTSGLIDYNVDVTVEKVASTTSTNMVLHAAVTESHIDEFWQGQSELNFVCRLMVPNQYGTSLDFSSGNTQLINLQFSLEDEWVAEECELVVFIQDLNTKEILQGTNIGMMEFGAAYNYDAALNNVSNLPDKTCSGVFEPTITIRNHGADNLTSLDIKYYVNNGEISTSPWSGDLAYLESEIIDLSAISFDVLDENELVIYTENPNGNPDQYPYNDTAILVIEKAMYTPQIVNLILRTDNNPEETSWDLLSYDGTVLYSGGPYTSSGSMVQEEFELIEAGCYTFNMYDSGGDGFDPPGFYMLYYGSSTTIVQGTEFGLKSTTEFNADDDVGISEPALSYDVSVYPNPFSGQAWVSVNLPNAEDVSLRMFNVLGEMVYDTDYGYLETGNHTLQLDGSSLVPGIYFIKIAVGNDIVTKKVTIRK